MKDYVAWCVVCGPLLRTDEDGCCMACGCDAVGDGARAALKARRGAARLRDEVKELRKFARRCVLAKCVCDGEWDPTCLKCAAEAALTPKPRKARQ